MFEFPVAFTGGNGNNFGYQAWSEDQEPGPLLKPKNKAQFVLINRGNANAISISIIYLYRWNLRKKTN